MTPQIVLFSHVAIAENLSKAETIEYLKKYCTIDDLGDTIYVKKLCNKITFAIDYTLDEIYTVRKIKDKNGDNVNEILFENRKSTNNIDESICSMPYYDEIESQCIPCGGNLD